VTSEYELGCATCGGSLTRREVAVDSVGGEAAESLGLGAAESLEVAECPDCGGRYFPEATLERLGT
jgi:hypothetical protein